MSNNYPTTFRTYILGAVRYALAQVQATPNLLSDAVRQQALHALSYALDLPEAWPVVRDLLLAMAPKMEQAGHREDWILYLKHGESRSLLEGDSRTAAEFQLQIGLLYRLLSEFVSARYWLEASIATAKLVDNHSGKARALNELAWLAHLQQCYEDAAKHAQAAISLLDEDDSERGMSYRVLGMIAFYQGRLAESETYHRQSLRLFQHHHQERKIAWALQNTALALRDQKKLEDAVAYFQEAAMILQKINDNYHWSIVQMNLGIAYLTLQQPELALSCFLKTESTAHTLHDTLQLARSQNNLGVTFLALAKYVQAENAFLAAIELFDKLGNEGWRLNEFDGLAMVYIAQKQYQKAIEVLKEALSALPKIKETPNYQYLSKSLRTHLAEAKKGLDLQLKARLS